MSYTPYTPSEFTAGVYAYIRKDKATSFTSGIPTFYGKTAYPDKADFEFLM